MNLRAPGPARDNVVASTRAWIEQAVIGLNLCPFAKAAYDKDQIRYAVSDAQTAAALRDDLVHELRTLAQAAPTAVDTTLLIHPHVLTEFVDYNDFLGVADATVKALGLTGVLQVASFHPHISSPAPRRTTLRTIPTARHTRCSTCCAKPV